MKTGDTDITGDIGSLIFNSKVEQPKYPMYSYNRPAYNFWQGAYTGMIKLGKTHEQAIQILQSKAARCVLDGRDNEIENLGKRMAKNLIECWGDGK